MLPLFKLDQHIRLRNDGIISLLIRNIIIHKEKSHHNIGAMTRITKNIYIFNFFEQHYARI